MRAESLARTSPVQTKSLLSRTLNNPRVNAGRMAERALLFLILIPKMTDFVPSIPMVLAASFLVELAGMKWRAPRS